MDDTPLADRVIRYVLTMPDEEFSGFSVRKLSQILKIDRFKLLREFKHYAEMTLEEFLFKERMTRSAFLLLSYSDISIRDVAKRIGFCTCDYFIRVFRQYYGIVPGKYKEFKTQRSGIGDSRVGLKERRKKTIKGKIPGIGDRSKEAKDQRKGAADRGKQDNHHRECPQEMG